MNKPAPTTTRYVSCLTSFKTHVSRGFRLTAQCLVALISISRAYVLSHSTVSLENSETLVGFSMRRDTIRTIVGIGVELRRGRTRETIGWVLRPID